MWVASVCCLDSPASVYTHNEIPVPGDIHDQLAVCSAHVYVHSEPKSNSSASTRPLMLLLDSKQDMASNQDGPAIQSARNQAQMLHQLIYTECFDDGSTLLLSVCAASPLV
jgi:hypothetical protein